MLTVVTKSSLTAGVRWAALEGDGSTPLPGGAVAAALPQSGGEREREREISTDGLTR